MQGVNPTGMTGFSDESWMDASGAGGGAFRTRKGDDSDREWRLGRKRGRLSRKGCASGTNNDEHGASKSREMRICRRGRLAFLTQGGLTLRVSL